MKTWSGSSSTMLAAFGNGDFGVGESSKTNAADGAALTMLCIVAVVLGGIVLFAWRMVRQARKPNETLRFLETSTTEAPSSSAEPTPEGKNAETASKFPWEKPADWWEQK